jgi:NADH-quinone oxidoreductase subunit B
MELQKKIKGERLTGADAARHTRPESPSEFPIPAYGAHDLEPTKNPEVWKPAPPLPRSGKA